MSSDADGYDFTLGEQGKIKARNQAFL